MHNLSNNERQYIESAVSKGAKDAITIVDTKNGVKNGVSIIQTHKLPEFPCSIVFNEDVAQKLIEIYVNNQNKEIPFYISGALRLNQLGEMEIDCSSIYIPSLDDSNSSQYECQHTTEDAVKVCKELSKQIGNGKGILLLGHNHPVVYSDRQNNLQISNNFSTQDIEGVEDAIKHNIQYSGYENIFTMSLMVNHIGGLNVIFVFGNKYHKLTDINVRRNGEIINVRDYTHPTLNKKMNVFENFEDYEIPPSQENWAIIEDVVEDNVMQ